MAALAADHMVAYELALRGCSRKEAAPNWFCVPGAASHIGNNSARIGVDLPREFYVAPILRRVWCCGSRQHSRGNRHCSHDKARPLLAAMAMAKCAEGKKPPLTMALAPLWGYWRSLGRTSLFCVRGFHDIAHTQHRCRRRLQSAA